MKEIFSYQSYQTKMQQIADLKYASALLQWDQETYLPPKGNDFRGRQIATLTELSHELFIDEKTGSLLTELLLNDNLSDAEKRNISLSYEDYQKAQKIPASFVKRLSETVNKSFHAWIKARKANNFSIFLPELERVIDLKKQEAELIGYASHPYDALMDEFDKGMTVASTDVLFEDLKPSLLNLLQQIAKLPEPDNRFLQQHFDRDTQWKYGIRLLKEMHFDFEAGRQDISEHPFTTNFNSNDVRVTTRIDENDFGNMTWSCLHEGGHALYEQGLPSEQYGLPLGEYCSLSIHESQSRLWENNVGRSLPFWIYHYPGLQQQFPKQLGAIKVDQFYGGINKVSPSLIRTEADELTYHFHIMIRYELEKALIEGSLKAKEIPLAWADLYKKYLGITVPDDINGCLQDLHWSHGSFGYFATYSTGSLYAAQFFEHIRKQNPQIDLELKAGNSKSILQWLQQHIYPFGRYYTSAELCSHATGETLNSRYFINYATRKFSDIYQKNIS
jgi:carboxypeptidase Taq